MIDRLRTLSLSRRHPGTRVLSEYLDGDLDERGRHALEAHIRECVRCQRELASLADTLQALGSVEAEPPGRLAESIVAALRAESPARTPALMLVRDHADPTGRDRLRNRWSREARVALRWCLQRPQLRLTLPIALVAGIVLSMVNMGGMLMQGRINLGVCLSCAIDFLVPFLAMNLGVLMLLWFPRRGRV